MYGSSPLTRGKPELREGEGVHWRLIPAHAGKTAIAVAHVYVRQAHPRSRGENGEELLFVAGCRGSSPLTRGKPSGRTTGIRGRRLIPAHAGKTSLRQ